MITNTWEKSFPHYNEIDPEIINNRFIYDLDMKDKLVETTKNYYTKMVESVIDYNKDMDSKMLHKIFNESISNENILLLYELFYHFINLTKTGDYNLISGFFALLNESQKHQFYDLPRFCNYNFYFSKLYLVFIYSCQKYYKSSKVYIVY